jgi:hypothetical protein
MATQDLATNLDDALSQLYAPRLIRNFNRISVLAALLMKKPGAGKNVAWDAMFSGASAAAYADGADVAAYDVDTPVPATLGWGLYRSSFAITGLAQAAAATSQGSAEELIDLIDTSAENSAMKLISLINADLYAGDGTGGGGEPTIVGLASALDSTGTYANIAKGTYAEWAGNELANGGTPRALTKSLLDTLETTIYKRCAERPTIIVASPEVCQKYEGLFDSITRVILSGPGELSAQSAMGRMSSSILPDNDGFTGFHYKGMPVYRDKDCQAGTLYMINSRHTELRFLPQPSVNTATIAASKELAGLPGTNMAGLAARIESMAKTGDADKFSMKLYLQLKVSRPNASGFLADISES